MRCFFMCKLLPSKPDGFARFPFLSSAVTSVPLFVTCGDISPRRGENLSRPGEVVLGEGASGETVHFAIQPETVPPCQKPNPLSHRCAMPAPPRGELLGFFRSAQIKLPLRGSWHRAAMTERVRLLAWRHSFRLNCEVHGFTRGSLPERAGKVVRFWLRELTQKSRAPSFQRMHGFESLCVYFTVW